MTESAWHWEEGNLESEDPSIGVPAASLARIPIRNGERVCNRRKSGDLTFDPISAECGPDADLFARHGRPEHQMVPEEIVQPEPESSREPPGKSDAASGDIIDASALLGSGGRAALTRAKPAVRRRSPLADLDRVDPPADRAAERDDAMRPTQAGAAATRRSSHPVADRTEETKSGWRSALSRWRKKVGIFGESSMNGAEGRSSHSHQADDVRAPEPSRNSNLYDYWSQLRRGRKMPAWSEIRIDEVARAWPNSFIVSFERKSDDRSGASPVARARRITPEGPNGHDPDTLRLTDTVIEWILATAREAVKHGEPVQDRESFGMHDGLVCYGIVAVPFTGDHSGIEHILCHIKQLPASGASRRAS